MKFVLQPRQILPLVLAGWINKHQQDVIEYLPTENRTLREMPGKRRIPPNDDQRRGLAIKDKVLGRKGLSDICTLVTPETILRWHHTLVADKWLPVAKLPKTGNSNI